MFIHLSRHPYTGIDETLRSVSMFCWIIDEHGSVYDYVLSARLSYSNCILLFVSCLEDVHVILVHVGVKTAFLIFLSGTVNSVQRLCTDCLFGS